MMYYMSLFCEFFTDLFHNPENVKWHNREYCKKHHTLKYGLFYYSVGFFHNCYFLFIYLLLSVKHMLDQSIKEGQMVCMACVAE